MQEDFYYYQVYQLGTGRLTQKAQASTRCLPISYVIIYAGTYISLCVYKEELGDSLPVFQKGLITLLSV